MENIAFGNPIFYDEQKAREYLEDLFWGEDKSICPHCGLMGEAYLMKSKSIRNGLWKCKGCKKPFTVTIGTIFQGSHLPLTKWFQAIFLMCSSKKGISAKQLERNLDITYKTAWFLAHRIREMFKEGELFKLIGDKDSVIEADETFWGSKKKKIRGQRGWWHKEKIFCMVNRETKEKRSFHVQNVDGRTLKPIMKKHINKKSRIITDDMGGYSKLDELFKEHDIICHSKKEYKKGEDIHTNTVEGSFSILKRGLNGIFQWVSPHHLWRYLVQFDFLYSTCKMTDTERFIESLKRSGGKRLFFKELVTFG